MNDPGYGQLATTGPADATVYPSSAMFGHRITLFRTFGFEVRLDLSWILLGALITFQMAGILAEVHPAESPGVHWGLACVGAVGLFLSIVFHELSHSLVARRYGISIRGITLFAFGGVAEMDDEPPTPRSEFFMAVVGPISSVVLGGALLAATRTGSSLGSPAPVVTLGEVLAALNFLVAMFNMVPAFPLDGGRILRSLLWWRSKDLRSATRVTSRIGVGFGMFLMLTSPLWLVEGQYLNAGWSFLIGLFVCLVARMQYRQLVMKGALEGESVRRFMVADPVVVPRSIPVRELVHDYLYRYHFKIFPVVDGERLVGCVTLAAVKALPRDEWGSRTVGEISMPCGPDNTVGPDEPAMLALTRMSTSGDMRLMVVEGGRLLGVLTVSDLLAFIATKLELEGR